MPRAVFLLLLALAVPSASAATAFLPLSPGDSVHATDGPADRDLRIEQIFGQSVAVIDTNEPALVGIQVRHSDDSLTTHVLFTEGLDLIDLQTEVNQLKESLTQVATSLQNLSDATQQAATTQTHEFQTIEATVANLTKELAALDDQLAIIRAAATESNQLVRNLKMPDLEPIQAQLDETDAAAKKLESQLTAAIVLAAFTLMGVIGALLHTAWPHMRHWLPQPRDAPDDQEDDLDLILAEEQAKAEALAVELVPGSIGAAGHLESNELRDKLTPQEEE